MGFLVWRLIKKSLLLEKIGLEVSSKSTELLYHYILNVLSDVSYMRILKRILRVKANLPFLINLANFPSKESKNDL